jgi:GDP-4-dehydro-6-deoxy-D-mannose reductase
MRVLVSGATGFVGRYLIRHLLEVTRDVEIVGTTRRSGVESWDARLRLVPCDLSRPGAEDARRLIATERPDQIYHLAGASSGAAADHEAVFSANVLGTQRLMAAVAAETPPARCLFTSSGYVYGPCDARRPAREGDALKPLGVYAESKRDAERYARDAGAVVARAFNHTGPGQTDAFVVPAFARQIALIERGLQPPQIEVGNLEAQRDFLDVRDVVRAYHALLNQGRRAETYNVCRGEAYPLQTALSDLLALSSQSIEVVQAPQRMRAGDIPVSVGDPSKLTFHTGWTPQVAFPKTLEDTLDWWRAQM